MGKLEKYSRRDSTKLIVSMLYKIGWKCNFINSDSYIHNIFLTHYEYPHISIWLNGLNEQSGVAIHGYGKSILNTGESFVLKQKDFNQALVEVLMEKLL